jgi:hypothetical protein
VFASETLEARLLAACTALLSVSAASAQVPTLVQHDSSSSVRSNSATNAMQSPFCYHFQPPEPATQGNALIVGFQYQGNTVTPSVMDDKTDSFAVVASTYDASDNRTVAVAAAFGVTGGARKLRLCFTADPGGFAQPMVSEFSNVVGVDGTGAGSSGSGTLASAGPLTPSAQGELAYQVTASFTSTLRQSSFAAGSQANIAWSLLSADLMDAWAAQAGVYASTSALTPAMTLGTSAPWASVAVLFKSGAAGAAPGGMRIVHLVHENVPFKTGGGGDGTSFPNPTALQFPSSGNLLVAMTGGGLAQYINGITDSTGESWIPTGMTYMNPGNDTVKVFYVADAQPANGRSLTVNWSQNTSDQTLFLYDISGADTSPLDTSAGEGGDSQSTTMGSYTPPFTLTPAGAGELVLAEIIWDYNTDIDLSCNNGVGLVDVNYYDGESLDGPCPIDENNGWGHVYTANAAAMSFTWSGLNPTEPVGGSAAISVAFKPASAADAGATDSGSSSPDAGPTPDAGGRSPDAGPAGDGGAVDAGAGDAGGADAGGLGDAGGNRGTVTSGCGCTTRNSSWTPLGAMALVIGFALRGWRRPAKSRSK